MVDDFGEKLMHNKGTNLRKDGLNMTVFNRRLKFVKVYTCKHVHSPTSRPGPCCSEVRATPDESLTVQNLSDGVPIKNYKLL